VLETVRRPPRTVATDLPVMPGTMRRWDLISYRALFRKPTRIGYRGLVVHGMPPSSSGGTTVGEALGILRGYDLGSLPRAQALHVYLEASALAFADRSKYLGDPAYVNVPVRELLSPGFLAERRCEIDAAEAAPKPVAAGSADGDYTSCQQPSAGAGVLAPDTTGPETTHLSAADRWGNVASFTLTIEQTGGSGITVPGRGFILNNELTDFSPVYDEADPNRIEGGKRPRSSMSPTLVLRDGKPVLAVGSPGGSTIITTVLQRWSTATTSACRCRGPWPRPAPASATRRRRRPSRRSSTAGDLPWRRTVTTSRSREKRARAPRTSARSPRCRSVPTEASSRSPSPDVAAAAPRWSSDLAADAGVRLNPTVGWAE
jgi:hypothetical protein